MKKSILILAAVAAIAFTGCGTTKKVAGSGIKGNAAKVQKNVVTILDY